MAIIDGWLDWAERLPGPADKVYSQRNAGNGIVCHSMEGYGYYGIHGRMMNTSRDPDGRYTAYAQASWMFSNMVDGTFIQHYPVTASTWTSGNAVANTTLWGVESEGTAGNPLTIPQILNMLRLAKEFEAYTGKKATRDPAARTVWQHNEVWNWATPNAGPTACPSGRYNRFFELLEEQEMTNEERELLYALVSIMGGKEKIMKARDDGMDYLLGYALEQQQQREIYQALLEVQKAVKELRDYMRQWAK
jgi:hypothetical protein